MIQENRWRSTKFGLDATMFCGPELKQQDARSCISAIVLDGNLFPCMRIASPECTMPRFYFHIQTIDGLNEEDDVGAVFRSQEDAIREASDLANQMMLDATKARHYVKHIIEVMDADRKVLARLDCTAAIDAKPSNDGFEDQKR